MPGLPVSLATPWGGDRERMPSLVAVVSNTLLVLPTRGYEDGKKDECREGEAVGAVRSAW